MPLYNFFCKKCAKLQKKLAPKRPAEALCKICKEPMSTSSDGAGVSSLIYEEIDDGRPRKVVRLANIDELNEQRELQDNQTDDIV